MRWPPLSVPHCESLARLAVEETGYGVVADKIQKNLFAAERVYQFIRPMRTVGVLQRLEDKKVVEIAEPFGVVAAVVPSTNPTSTAIYKILISLKARCAIVISPHPSAVRCITRVAEIMGEAARAAGAPDGSISWMTTRDARRHAGVDEEPRCRGDSRDWRHGARASGVQLRQAGLWRRPRQRPLLRRVVGRHPESGLDIIIGKTFDNGLLCSSPNSVVVDAAIADEIRRQFVHEGAYFLNPAEIEAVAKVLSSVRSGCRIRRSSDDLRPSSLRRPALPCPPARAC